MRIESLKQSERKGGRTRLVFDDGSTLVVLPGVVADFGLCAGDELDETRLAALKQAAAEASAKARAVRIISTTGVTKRELEQRLVQKGETAADARAAVEWLDELQLLDDAETARQIVARGVSRGYGKNRIQQMLYEKRVPKEYWDAALAAMPDMDGALDEFLQKRLQGSNDRKDIDRAMQAAARRGYSWAEIKAAVRRYNDSVELEEV